ncbi:hypothetical protein F441_01788 [Phytophthora nicotianae CJ01A1]|uniref:Core-binding (CB) domain-containing protein n=1 Tax=Phytophthora nicotianae CJ01A1 TaxID=1317063 RepID=W2XS38_PHYNI|nr:hypothetical protein F441_01788 [Phytophthora nicotianae CJ01A1]
MSDGSSQPTGGAASDVEAIHDAGVSKRTRVKYKSSLNGIKRWIVKELSKEDANTGRFFEEHDELRFLVYKRSSVKTATLSGYWSAIKNLHRVKRLASPTEYGDGMKQLFFRLKRIEADNDQISTPKSSGKRPLTYSRYSELCLETLKINDGGFSHLFLTSQWSLMCRSMSVQTLQTQHLLAKDDSVGVVLVKTKTNQEGSGPRDPRHLYANPLSPSSILRVIFGWNLEHIFQDPTRNYVFGKILTGC